MIKTFLATALVAAGMTASGSGLPVPCSGKINRISLPAPQLGGDTYNIDIWTPQGYGDDPAHTYPVIYMQDGQNLFDGATVWNGQEWGVDEAITSLSAAGIVTDAVVVGIHNNSTRAADYTPQKALTGDIDLQRRFMQAWGISDIRGDSYLDFLVNTVRPYVEEHYSVAVNRDSISIMGSSMGGLISLYAICEYPEVFGSAGCLSTHWTGALDPAVTPDFATAYLSYLQRNLPDPSTHRIYLDHGTEGLDAYYTSANASAVKIALDKGYAEGVNLVSFIADGADHNEACWRERIGRPLRMLIPGEALTAANPSGLPGAIPDGVILHCFCWKLQDIISELPNIAAAGFTAVQTSPMERNVTAGDVWYDVYRPYDYRFIDNAMGTRDDMAALCAKAQEYGIKVIVDIVANHGTGKSEPHDPWWDMNGRMRWGTGGIDWNSRYSETHDELGGYGESNSEDPEVQKRTLDYIRDLMSLGVKGLRWDAAKHISLPSEGCNFWNVTMSEPGIWSYGEVLGLPAGDNGPGLLAEYTSLMHVTDPGFTGDYEHESHYWHNIAADRLVYWAESHDTYCNEGATASLPEAEIDRRWALVASRQGATALYLSRPPQKNNTAIKVAVKGSTHFITPAVAAVNHFHNAMGSLPETFTESDGAKVVYRTRGAVIVKEGGGKVSLPAGNLIEKSRYKDEITGTPFTLANGRLEGNIDPVTGIAVVYDCDNPGHPDAAVTVSSAGTAFHDTSFILTIQPHNAISATYSVNGGEPVDCDGIARIPLGRMLQPGQTAVVSWSIHGYHNDVTGCGSYTYRPSEEEQNVQVLLHFDDTDWNDNFYTFIYDAAGNSNGPWPGAGMTRDDALSFNGYSGGWLYYNVPADLTYSGMAMVSDNGPHRYPGNMAPGIPINGRSVVFMHHNGEWTTGPVSETPMTITDKGQQHAVPVSWHTLYGLPVRNPIAGQLYIVRYSDGTASKVIFR